MNMKKRKRPISTNNHYIKKIIFFKLFFHKKLNLLKKIEEKMLREQHDVYE